MATLGKNYITFRDINSGVLPDGTFDREIVELVAKSNPALDDVLWKQCNKGREDITTIRTGLPDATFRAYYEGVQGTKGSKKQVANSCGTVSTAIEFDARLYEDTKDKAQFLLDEAEAHAAAMGVGAAEAIFYGDLKDDPRGINGLSKVYAKANGSDPEDSTFYCLNALRTSGGTSALRSIFLVGWGKTSVYGIHPEGTVAGLDRGKLEFAYVDDGSNSNKKLRVGIQEMNWNLGLTVKDFRFAGRIANIETDGIIAGTSGVKDTLQLVHRLVTRVKMEGARPVFYMSRLAWECLVIQLYGKTSSNAVTYGNLQQRQPPTLLGIPVGLCDALETNEAQVADVA